MTTTEPDPRCRTIRYKQRMGFRPSTCIDELARGYINSTDLCPLCTMVFMTALDEAVGPLEWHPSFTARAAARFTGG